LRGSHAHIGSALFSTRRVGSGLSPTPSLTVQSVAGGGGDVTIVDLQKGFAYHRCT
jgi:hypothetical protein